MLIDFDRLLISIGSEPLRFVSDMLNRSRMMCRMNKFSVLCISEIYLVPLQWNKQKRKGCGAHRWVSLLEKACFPAKKTDSWMSIKRELRTVELCAGGSCCWVAWASGWIPAGTEPGIEQRQQTIYYAAKSLGSSDILPPLCTWSFLYSRQEFTATSANHSILQNTKN